TLRQNGVESGGPGIEIISGETLRRHEPNAIGETALHAPTGGIIDSGALVRSLAKAAQKSGVEFLFGHQVAGLEEKTDRIELLVGAKRISAELMVNCAGLYADKLAHMLGV